MTTLSKSSMEWKTVLRTLNSLDNFSKIVVAEEIGQGNEIILNKID